MKKFEGKVVLVTGGSAGIGLATSEAFAREGAKVVIAARRENEGIAAVEKIRAAGGVASFVRADVASEADVVAAVGHAVSKFGGLDVVFNNAGVEGKIGPIETLGVDDFDGVFAANVRGTWLVMKHALPHLKNSRGAIVNNSSVAADMGMAGTTVYAASKGAVATLTRTAAIEFIKSGVRVNAVSPGPIETEMGSRFFGSIENMRGFAASAVPSGAPGAPADVAEAVLFLASPAARFIVGQMVTMDGGLLAQ